MSEFRDRLPNDQMRAEYDEAVARAGRLLAAAYAELEQDQHEAQAA